MFAIVIQADLWDSCDFGHNYRFDCLKLRLQKINKLEDIISKIKYINGEKVSFELMDTVTKFDLFCHTQFPQQTQQ
jgi:hypothetical protein